MDVGRGPYALVSARFDVSDDTGRGQLEPFHHGFELERNATFPLIRRRCS